MRPGVARYAGTTSVVGRCWAARAVAVNIEIMRACRHQWALAMQHDTFSRTTRNQLKQGFDAPRELMTPPDPPKRPIRFAAPENKGKKTLGGKRQDVTPVSPSGVGFSGTAVPGSDRSRTPRSGLP